MASPHASRPTHQLAYGDGLTVLGACQPQLAGLPGRAAVRDVRYAPACRYSSERDVNSGPAGSGASCASTRWCAPTAISGLVSRASNATSAKPLAANHCLILGVRLGGRWCLVQITV